MLTLLTATGCRPQAWSICVELMSRQTYTGQVRWIVVDDGEDPQHIPPVKSNWCVRVIRPNSFWVPGSNTQSRNLAEGMKYIMPDERLVVIEDDDYYSANYLERVNEWLDKADLAGEVRARYYNVRTRKGKKLSNTNHASLCNTAMKGKALEMFRSLLPGNLKFIDMTLWREFKDSGGRCSLYGTESVVGIKGLPGRSGIGSGHDKSFGFSMDLKSWIGEDASLYEGLYQ